MNHLCGPGWVKTELLDGPGYVWREAWDVVVGTVVECGCGQTWICVRDPGFVSPTLVLNPHNMWHSESVAERRRRESNMRKARQPSELEPCYLRGCPWPACGCNRTPISRRWFHRTRRTRT